MPLIQESDLYMMVGEIRSDVKTLLEDKGKQDKRISSLERKFWTTTGAIALIAAAAPTVAKAMGLL